MPKKVDIEIIPIGEKDRLDRLPSHESHYYSGSYCSATGQLLNYLEWDENKIRIRWDAEGKKFTVEFVGIDKETKQSFVQDLLSKEIPLEIARTSNCECGGILELGNYSVQLVSDEFIFEAEYYCPACKNDHIAKSKGLKELIRRWIFGLKRIDITASGIGIERQ
jgi:hypothetical protein